MSANSDIKLQTGQVVVDAWDLCLDSPDRRNPNFPTPYRRALVHDPDDGLTMNWAKDYPGGVTISGNTRIDSNLEVEGEAKFKNVVEFLGKVKIQTVILTPIRQPSGATVNVPVTIQIDVYDEITKLKNEITQLKTALAAVQANWRYCDKCKGLWFAGGANKGVCPKDGGEHIQQGSGNYRLFV